MIDRKALEEREFHTLSKYAAMSSKAKRSQRDEEPCAFRTSFQRDKDRIIHSKAFRRLMHKTQVFLASERDHYRTRLTHTFEVSQIARTIARGLGLNEDLTEAIALGHDLGHTPFGHSGEAILNAIHPSGFKHNEQSLRVVDVLEHSGGGRRGMNLTNEVRDGILNHTGPVIPFTLEGQIVRFSDRIAYINHDIDDAVSAGVLQFSDLPQEPIGVLGDTHSKRINHLVSNVVLSSEGKAEIVMESKTLEHMNALRSFMFKHVYHSPHVKKEEDLTQVERCITFFYNHYMDNRLKLPVELEQMVDEFGLNTIVKDYIASMTDRYAINLYKELTESEQ